MHENKGTHFGDAQRIGFLYEEKQQKGGLRVTFTPELVEVGGFLTRCFGLYVTTQQHVLKPESRLKCDASTRWEFFGFGIVEVGHYLCAVHNHITTTLTVYNRV